MNTGRMIGAASAASLGLAGALLAGGSFLAAAIALLGGASALTILLVGQEREVTTEAPPLPPAGPSYPSAADLLAAVPEPLLLVRDRRVLLANPAALELLGSHIEGVDVRLALRHPAAADRLTGDAPPGSTSTELVGLGHGDSRWEMTVNQLADGSRLVRLTDRSEAHATEKMRGDFVANASHELRTPLATLLGFLETLQDEKAASDPKTRSRFIAIMYDEARRMHRLVDDLISLSRIEAERFAAPRDTVALLPLIDEIRRSCGRMAEDKGSAIVLANGLEEPSVQGDRAQLAQLLQNLVVNALKYGREGTPVTIGIEQAGSDMLRLSVADEGEGIAPEHLPRLTERFYRVDAGRSRAVGGTGLGLAIVKHIVGRHRGRLDISSEPGVGTRVDVWLPLSSKSHGSVTEDSP